jgi:hypothetical protein
MRSECKALGDTPSEVQPLKRLYAFTVQKRDDGANNEDQWCESPDGMICAVSDGASVSFDSGLWAEILVRRFTSDPNVSRDWIKAAIAEYSAAHDREAMPWMHQAAFDRGSFATLLGVWFLPDWQGARVFAIGDTILAFVDGGQLVRTIPYVQPDEFDQPPQLLSTSPAENRSLDDEAISHAWQELNIASHEAPTLLLMTDALGRWLLDQPDSERVYALLNVHDEQAFREFVERERAEGRLKRDDTTLVVIGVSGELSADH